MVKTVGKSPRAFHGLCLVLLMALSCSAGIRIGRPLQIVSGPGEGPRLPLSVVILEPEAPISMEGELDPKLETRLRQALAQGMAEATGCLAARVVIGAAGAGEADFIITPTNISLEVDRHLTATFSMDVSILRTRDQREFGLLAEGRAGPGKTPALVWEGGGGSYRLIGARLRQGRLGQALNRALFFVVFDYLKKLDRRLSDLL